MLGAAVIYVWWMIGGFDWVNDTIECINYSKPVIDPMQQKITMSVEEYLNTIMSFKQIKASPDVVSYIETIKEGISRSKVMEEVVAKPGIKIIGIEEIQENISESWRISKTKKSVLRLN